MSHYCKIALACFTAFFVGAPVAAAQASVNQRHPVFVPHAHPGNAEAAARRKRATANSCVAQANKAHLKGDKRRQFLKTCKPR